MSRFFPTASTLLLTCVTAGCLVTGCGEQSAAPGDGTPPRNGDRVTTLNGSSINDPESALDAYAAVRNAGTLSVVLERNGQPLTITYRVVPPSGPGHGLQPFGASSKCSN